jgi:hypothetical protein
LQFRADAQRNAALLRVPRHRAQLRRLVASHLLLLLPLRFALSVLRLASSVCYPRLLFCHIATSCGYVIVT